MQEVWKDIEGYEGYYQVSNVGRVRSLDRYVQGKNGSSMFLKGKILSQGKDKRGYLQLRLSKNNVAKTNKVHRLVAKAFIDNIYNLPDINHKDEIKSNNMVNNLEWCDVKYNNNYGTKGDRQSQKISKTTYQYEKDGCLVRVYKNSIEIEEVTGFNRVGIQECCLGKVKIAYGYVWSYIPLSKEEVRKVFDNQYHKPRRVKQLTLDNKIINIYNALREVERKTGFNTTNVSNACKNRRNTNKAYGFRWEFIED